MLVPFFFPIVYAEDSVSVTDPDSNQAVATLTIIDLTPEPQPTPKPTPPSQSSSGGGSSGGGGSRGGGSSDGFTLAPNLIMYDFCSDNSIVRVVATTHGDNLSAKITSNSDIYTGVDVTSLVNPLKYIDPGSGITPYVFDFETKSLVSFIVTVSEKSKKEASFPINIRDECSGHRKLFSTVGVTTFMQDKPFFTFEREKPVEVEQNEKEKPVEVEQNENLIKTFVSHNDEKYEFTHNNTLSIHKITPEPDNKYLNIYLNNTASGPITIELPTTLIKNPSVVLINDMPVDASVDGNVITIELPEDVTHIVVAGSWVVPEFGLLSILILSITMMTVLIWKRSYLSYQY